jgi:hypothetical protein
MPTADDLRSRAERLRQALPPRRRATPPEDQGRRLATIHRTPIEELRISWSCFEGHEFLNLRVWTADDGGGWWPDSRKGLSIKLRELPEFAEGIASALELAEQAATRPPPPMPGRKWNAEALPTPEPPADAEVFDEFAGSES